MRYEPGPPVAAAPSSPGYKIAGLQPFCIGAFLGIYCLVPGYWLHAGFRIGAFRYFTRF
jgi:hypothetical protein